MKAEKRLTCQLSRLYKQRTIAKESGCLVALTADMYESSGVVALMSQHTSWWVLLCETAAFESPTRL